MIPSNSHAILDKQVIEIRCSIRQSMPRSGKRERREGQANPLAAPSRLASLRTALELFLPVRISEQQARVTHRREIQRAFATVVNRRRDEAKRRPLLFGSVQYDCRR